MNATLRDKYEAQRATILLPLAKALGSHLESLFADRMRIDRISVRVKSTDRFLAKAAKVVEGTPKYSDPLRQIQDQIGARIVTFYRPDVEALSQEIEKHFRSIETRKIVPESDWEFGYEGKHYVLLLPRDVFSEAISEDSFAFFELQLKTVFQHAWSEAEHDLGYKPPSELTREQKRKLAFTSAQAWGADNIFEALFADLSNNATTPPDASTGSR